jgi:hypothetical protein
MKIEHLPNHDSRSSSLSFDTAYPTVYWSCDEGCDRNGTELAFGRVVEVLSALPKAKWASVFVTTAEEQSRAGRKPFWDIRRSPESLLDWILLGLIVTFLGSAIIAGLGYIIGGYW